MKHKTATQFKMPETQYIWYETGERLGMYDVLTAGNEVHVYLPETAFNLAVQQNSMMALLQDAAQAIEKYRSRTRVLMLWPEQLLAASIFPSPFQEAGFDKICGMEPAFDPR